MFELGLEFANMTRETCTRENIIRIFAAHGVFTTLAGQKMGFETHIELKGHVICLTEGFYSQFKQEHGNATATIHTWDEADYDEVLWAWVSDVKRSLCKWYDHFINEDPIETQMVENLLKELQVKLVPVSDEKGKFLVRIDIACKDRFLKNQILYRETIVPLNDGHGAFFQKIRRCPECGTYFFGKDIRKVFCSNKCRGSNAYRLKKSQN